MDYSKILAFLRSAKGSTVYAILSNWYVLIAIPALAITYNVLTNDTVRAVLQNAYNELDKITKHTIYLSTTCPSLITNFQAFMDCLGK